MNRDRVVGALLIGLCIAIAGISIGYGFYKGRASDRYVTVKGLAEREVKADLAIWPISFTVAANDLGRLQIEIDSDREAITEFLLSAGFGQDEISYSAPHIIDTEAERRHGGGERAPYRYLAEATVTTRTGDVALVKASMESVGSLVGKGLVLADQSWRSPTEFLFTSLNDIKPDMIEEATKDARRAATKFAEDSQSKVGKIRHASQGYFSINDRDRNSPEFKKIRVVTSIQYYLVD
ncbi:MAG: SIMPL domain-containing protein [bacterium]|jgi:hypothetical protein